MLSTSITDSVVVLRPFHMDDAIQLYEAVHESVADIKPWMSWAYDGYSLEDVDGFIKMNRTGWDKNTMESIDARIVYASTEQSDETAKQILNETCQINVIALLHPELVIVGEDVIRC